MKLFNTLEQALDFVADTLAVKRGYHVTPHVVHDTNEDMFVVFEEVAHVGSYIHERYEASGFELTPAEEAGLYTVTSYITPKHFDGLKDVLTERMAGYAPVTISDGVEVYRKRWALDARQVIKFDLVNR